VVKIPRWDLKKFRKVSPIIGSEMKSVGEVMAIGRCFEEALQKALRMLNIGVDGLVANSNGNGNDQNNLEQDIKQPTPERVFAIARALEQGVKIAAIHQWSKIDPWFLHKIKNIVETSREIKKAKKPNHDLILKAKQQGFADKQIGRLLNCSALKIKNFREKQNILPLTKQIDTLAAEYPAKTNYLYLTYNGIANDLKDKNQSRAKKIMVLGSGPYCIGSSVEFDWCCVNAVRTLRQMGCKTIVVNCNPETVSTDYDECDKLYFEELTVERVMDIYQKEKPLGVIVAMGGQIPNNLSLKLAKAGAKILGTKASDIDRAEDRHKFSQLLDELNIEQPLWQECSDLVKARNFAKQVGYPVLVRPSYVLSGAAMSVVFQESDLENYLKKAAQINNEHPVVVTKFITGAKEIELDAVAQKGVLLNYVITEHVENAGVHSGDATIVMPAHKLYVETLRQIKAVARQLAAKLNITGPFNIQFLAKNNKIKVIECNLRASRTMPFISKVSKVNLIDLATRAMVGQKVEAIDFKFVLDYVAVKAPQFSFARLAGADPILNVEMSSTGEVACFGDTLEEAYLKSLLATGFKIPQKNILLSLGGIKNQSEFLDPAKKLCQMGYQLYATPGTSRFLNENGCSNKPLQKISSHLAPNVKDYLEQGKIDLVINIADDEFSEKIPDDYFLRRKAVDFETPLFTNLQAAELFVTAISTLKMSDLTIKSWKEYK
ncbi:MAG: carbamoyl-phosphate synthase large subunit, partial [Patescibacteria group bacterium]